MPRPHSPPSDDAPFDAFVREFSRRIATASEETPTTRCVSSATLASLFLDVARALDRRGVPMPASGRACQERLQKMGLLREVPLDQPEGTRLPVHLFLVGLGSAKATPIDPREMLQAAVPVGVCCYFTALQHHELTTQSPTHHHIAQLTEYPSRPATSRRRRPVSRKGTGKSRRDWDPLGTRLFTYEDLAYYRTNRDRSMVAGVQRHRIHPRAIVRITTSEQTLIDTLHKPLSCGGPAVVLEAWDTGLREMEETRLVALLRKIDRPALARRVGCMLERLEYRPGKALANLMSRARATIDRKDPAEPLPFLPGVPSRGLDERWLLQVPS